MNLSNIHRPYIMCDDVCFSHRKNLLSVEVYFQDLAITEIVAMPLYEVHTNSCLFVSITHYTM